MRPTTRNRQRKRIMNAGAYEIVAGIINKIEDEELRLKIADHFSTEFNRRSQVFDPAQWEKRTGGRPAPNSAA